jgi:four helix bundle protein
MRTAPQGSPGPRRVATENKNKETVMAINKDPRYDLEERLLDYAARILRLVETLPKTRAATHVGGQLLRSGTSPLLNHGEVEAAESRKDFIHKLKICLKELRESDRNLKLTHRVPLIANSEELTSLRRETDELIRIFVSSIKTAERRKPNREH